MWVLRNPPIVQLLADAGTDIHIADHDGVTALLHARRDFAKWSAFGIQPLHAIMNVERELQRIYKTITCGIGRKR